MHASVSGRGRNPIKTVPAGLADCAVDHARGAGSKKNGRLRRPFESIPGHPGRTLQLEIVGALAMLCRIETLCLDLFRNAQADDYIHELVADECDHTGPHDRDTHAPEL